MPDTLPLGLLISAARRYAKTFEAMAAQADLLRESLIAHGATPSMIPGDVEDVLRATFVAQVESQGLKAEALYQWLLSKLDVHT